MSKLQNAQDNAPVQIVRSLTPPQYQALHRHYDAVSTLAEHMPKEGECLCGAKLSDLAWAEHMADILFPIAKEPA